MRKFRLECLFLIVACNLVLGARSAQGAEISSQLIQVNGQVSFVASGLGLLYNTTGQGTVSVTLPDGATVRESDVYIIWSGKSDTTSYHDTEAEITVNGIPVVAPVENFTSRTGCDDKCAKTYWAKVPGSAQVPGPTDFDFVVTDVFDFQGPNKQTWGVGVVVVYEHPALPQGWVQFRPWGQFVRPDRDEDGNSVENITSPPMTFSFSALNANQQFNPVFIVADTHVLGYDELRDIYRPSYLMWAWGTGNPLSGSYSWQQVTLTGDIDPPNKPRAYFGEARDGLSWDTLTVDNGIISPLTVPVGTEWVAFRLRIPGSGDTEPDEPLNSQGESLTWSGGGGTFQPVVPTLFPTPTPMPTLTPTITPTPIPTPTISPTPTVIVQGAWLDTIDGNIYDKNMINIPVPFGKYLMQDSSDSSLIGGAGITAGSYVMPSISERSERGWSLDGYRMETNSLAISYEQLQDKYGYDGSTRIDFISPESLASDGVYKVTGDLHLTDSAAIRSTDVNAIVFVDGNMRIGGNFAPAPPEDADDNQILAYRRDYVPSLMFIIRGDLKIDAHVDSVYGVYLVGQDVSTGVSNTRLYWFGNLFLMESILAQTLDFGRDLYDDNGSIPAETFVFMPKYFFTLARLVGDTRMSWLEVHQRKQ